MESDYTLETKAPSMATAKAQTERLEALVGDMVNNISGIGDIVERINAKLGKFEKMLDRMG